MRSVHLLASVVIAYLLSACSCSNKDQNNSQADSLSTLPQVVTLAESWMEQGLPQQPQQWHSLSARDTLSLGDHLLSFSVSRGSFPDYYDDQTIRDSVTIDYGDDLYKSLAWERYLQTEYDSLFIRTADTLKFTANSQHHWQLINSDSQRYSLEHYIDSLDLFLVKVHYSIGSSYLLLNNQNGKATYLWGRPYIKGDRLVAINNDQRVQYGANGIQYFVMKGDTLEPAWSLGLSNWGPTALKWIGNDSLLIRREYITPRESEEVYISDEVMLIVTPRAVVL